VPDNTITLVAQLLTKAAQLRRTAEGRTGILRRRLVEVAQRFEDKAQELLRERPIAHPSQTYRVYFRNDFGICGRDDFEVKDDRTALTIAGLLGHACSDACTSFEVWQGTRQVSGVRRLAPWPYLTFYELSAKRQALVIEREEVIKDSAFAIANSRRLLKQLDEARSKLRLTGR